jgi:aspartyl-tRNA(Asn)/glutamyl-tRNA(Gln) amidotransferase subunit B
VDFFDSATPGTMPHLNSQCVKLAIRAARATNCKLSTQLIFDRKHYNHWDLPAGYQITQKRWPLGLDGSILISQNRKIRIKQIHLEQVNKQKQTNKQTNKQTK